MAKLHHERIQWVRELLEKFEVEKHLVDVSEHKRHNLESSLLHRQQGVELGRRLAHLHIADLADLLETLPAEERVLVWHYIPDDRRAEVLLELDDVVRKNLLGAMPKDELLNAMVTLDADDLAFLADDLPEDILQEALKTLASEDRRWVHNSLSYSESVVGYWMSSEMVVVRQNQSLKAVQEQLLVMDDLPVHTDKIFVTDIRGILCGILPLKEILLNAADTRVDAVMVSEVVSFRVEDEADEAARAFERYDLVSAPVIDERNKVVGRITVDVVMDYVREEAEKDALNVAGVNQVEDLFAGIWASARNRWLWLSINLVSAFVISRIIGSFETTIVKLVALASLMPIVASVAGNTGNQTTAIVIRSLALEQINRGTMWHLFRKEISISALNGIVWGAVVGLFAYIFYQSSSLSVVVSVAMILSFVVAALFGVSAPIVLDKFGRDPAMGSSVILTGVTDALGFLIFLSLATLFLI